MLLSLRGAAFWLVGGCKCWDLRQEMAKDDTWLMHRETGSVTEDPALSITYLRTA